MTNVINRVKTLKVRHDLHFSAESGLKFGLIMEIERKNILRGGMNEAREIIDLFRKLKEGGDVYVCVE